MKDLTALTPLERSYLDECAFLAYKDASKQAELAAAVEEPCVGIADVYRISGAIYDAMGDTERNYYDKALSDLSPSIGKAELERRYSYYRTCLQTLGIAEKTTGT